MEDSKGFRKVIQELLVPELTEIKLRLAGHDERFTSIEQRFLQVDQRFQQVDQRFDQVDRKLGRIEGMMDQVRLGQAEILGKLDLEKRVTRLEALHEQQRGGRKSG